MRLYVIGDEESTIMFHLIGIESEIAEEDTNKFHDQMNKILNDSSIGIIMITESLMIKHKEFIIPLKMKRRSPIILEIPEMIPKYKEEYVNDVISKSIGFQLLS